MYGSGIKPYLLNKSLAASNFFNFVMCEIALTLDEKYIAFGNSYLVSLNNNVNITVDILAVRAADRSKSNK